MVYGVPAQAQFTPLLWAVGLGFLSGLLWDVFRVLRIWFPPGRIRLFAEDVLFFLVWALLTFLLCYAVNFGQIRAYILLAQPFGFFTWYCMLGKVTKWLAEKSFVGFTKYFSVPIFKLYCRFRRFHYRLQIKKAENKKNDNKKQKKSRKNRLKMKKKTCKQTKNLV